MNINIILNSVREHNYFITQGNYIGCMFRLLFSHLQVYFVNEVTRCYALTEIPVCLRDVCVASCDLIDKIGLNITEQ